MINGLEPGTTITAREIKTVDGFVLDGTPKTVKITAGSQAPELTFWNKRAGELVIRKLDSMTKKPLAEVEFQLTYAGGGYVDNANGHLSSNGLYTTDANGEIRISGVTGTIVVRETKTISGYIIDEATRTQMVEVRPEDTQFLTFYNQPLCTLTILKRDAVTQKPLKGAEFTVRDSEGRDIGRYVTGTAGTVTVTGLIPDSTYVVSESKAPTGYITDATPKNIVVRSGIANSLTFDNEPTTTLIIQKYVDGTTVPIQGVAFLVTDSSGAVVGNSNGEYVTDRNGRIVITGLTPGTTITARETKTVSGYVLDTTPQSILIKSGTAQALTFLNKAEGGLELIKVNEADRTQRIPNVTFEIRRLDGGLVNAVTTDKNGRVYVLLDAGDYYAVEVQAAEGFKLDATLHYFTVKDGKTTTLTVTNKPYASILIHKTDSATGKGIQGVSFLLYDSTNRPIGQYVSDNNGDVYIEGLTEAGRYYLKELENPGYLVDTQMKTVYIKAGETTLVEWANAPITGQIQITKTSADYNSNNGWAAGSPIPGTVFEIYDWVGNLVDTVQTDKNGVAASKPLPLGRYKMIESQSADFYLLDKTPFTAELEFAGQIVRVAMTNRSVSTGVSIEKRGYGEVIPGQNLRYTFSGIANTSNVSLTSFFWRDALGVTIHFEKENLDTGKLSTEQVAAIYGAFAQMESATRCRAE